MATTNTTPAQATGAAPQPEPPKPFSMLLLASDGTPGVEGAIVMARLLAERDKARVHVLTVVEPLPVITPEVSLPLPPEVEEARRTELAQRVREQLLRVAPGASAWDIELVEGVPDATIVRTAREDHAGAIVVGLGEHRMVDRLFGGETALRLIRMADVPILAAAPGATTLPTHAMAAVDFSETGNLAIRAALPLLAPDATLTLVHVVARDISLGAWPAWDDAYLKAVNASFDLLKSQLRLPPGVTVNTVVLRGDPPGELLAWASQHKVDLLVTGSHGHNFVVRTLLGRVSTKLVRGARCSVLIAPPRLRA